MKMKECKVWLSVLSAPERIGQIKELTKDLDHVRVIAPSLGAWLEVNAADEGFDIISRNIDDYFSTCPKPEVTYSTFMDLIRRADSSQFQAVEGFTESENEPTEKEKMRDFFFSSSSVYGD